MLILDETADEKAGTHNAGASRQYNGRLGKVDVCRVDTVLAYCHPAARVWTVFRETVRPEWLVIRREGNGKCRFTLLNGPAEASAQRLVERSGWRYYVERLIEDGKSGLGWDEFRAQKDRATEHHLALPALATWFVAQTKLEWSEQHPRDERLARELELPVLPALSTANVREMLQAVLPLPDLTPGRARAMVVEHLVHRSRSMRSRLRKQRAQGSSP